LVSKLRAFIFGYQTQVFFASKGSHGLKLTGGQKIFGFMQMHFTSSMCIKSIHQIISLHEYIIMHGKKKKSSEELRGLGPQE